MPIPSSARAAASPGEDPPGAAGLRGHRPDADVPASHGYFTVLPEVLEERDDRGRRADEERCDGRDSVPRRPTDEWW